MDRFSQRMHALIPNAQEDDDAMEELRAMLTPVFRQIVRSCLEGKRTSSTFQTLLEEHDELFREAIELGQIDRTENLTVLCCSRFIKRLLSSKDLKAAEEFATQLLTSTETTVW